MKFEKVKDGLLAFSEKQSVAINLYEEDVWNVINTKRNAIVTTARIEGNNINPKKTIFIDVNPDEKSKLYINYNPLLQIENDNDAYRIVDIILENEPMSVAGCKILLSCLILFTHRYLSPEENVFPSILKLLQSCFTEIGDGKILMDNLISSKKTDENKRDSVFRLYAGYRKLNPEMQVKIAITLYEIMMPYCTEEYSAYSVLKQDKVRIDFKHESPCYMMYFKDFRYNKIDEKISLLFLEQINNLSKK